MIFFIHPWSPGNQTKIGGIEKFIADMLSNLSRPKNVTYLCADKNEFINGIRYIDVTRGSKIKRPHLLKFTLGVVFFLLKYNGKENLYVVHRPEIVPFLRLVKPKSLIVLFLHTDQLLNSSPNSDSYWSKFQRIYSIFMPICYKTANKIYILNKNSLPYVKQFNSSVELLGASVSEEFYVARPNLVKESVIWVGRLENVKNPLLAIDILNLISFTRDCVIIGEGTLLERCLKRLSHRVEYSPFIPRDCLSARMQKSKYMIMTSYFEGSPRVLVEALVSGCIIICNKESDPDSLNQTYPERIIHVDNLDVESYIAAYENLEKVKPFLCNEPVSPLEFSSRLQFTAIWDEVIALASKLPE